MAGYKADRMSEDIKREIASVVRELKDPRVSGKMLTVVHVDVTHDLSYAKVYVSALEGIETAKMRDVLKDFRVESFQGYFYAKPMQAEDLMVWGKR